MSPESSLPVVCGSFCDTMAEWSDCKRGPMLKVLTIWPCGESLPTPPLEKEGFFFTRAAALQRASFSWITGKKGEQFGTSIFVTKR